MAANAKVLVLGANGMLGHVLVDHFHQEGHSVVGCGRDEFDPFVDDIDDIMCSDWDYVINCIAIIRQRMKDGWGQYKSVDPNDHMFIVNGFDCDFGPTDNILYQSSMINASFPWMLASKCKEKGTKMIHISTPAVFNEKNDAGVMSGFSENDKMVNDHSNIYSTTKAWGEPSNCMVLRMSAVGHEKPGSKKLALLEWFKAQDGNENVYGYVNHWWNGMTTKQASICIEKIVANDWHVEGKRNMFSPKPISKLDTLVAIRDQLNLNIDIKPYVHEDTVVEILATEYGLNDKLEIPNFLEQVKEL